VQPSSDGCEDRTDRSTRLLHLQFGQLAFGGFTQLAAALSRLLEVSDSLAALAFAECNFTQVVAGQLGWQQALTGNQIAFSLIGIAQLTLHQAAIHIRTEELRIGLHGFIQGYQRFRVFLL